MSVMFDRGTKEEIENGAKFMPKFDADGLIPAVVQDYQDGRVLMVAWMNQEAVERSIDLGEAVFWSRSRQEMWHKGQTSGNVQKIKEILVDCDQDCLVIKVEQLGGAACHTGQRSCFYRSVGSEGELTSLGEDALFDPKDVYGK